MPASNPDDFVSLYTRYERKLYRYVAALLSRPDDAEDVLQETARVLWQKFGQYRPEEPFLPWACAIARYEVLNHCQRERTRRKHFRPAVIELLADARLKNDDLLEAQSRWLQECVEKLAEIDRRLIEQRYASERNAGRDGRGIRPHAQCALQVDAAGAPDTVGVHRKRAAVGRLEVTRHVERSDQRELIDLAFAVCDGVASEERSSGSRSFWRPTRRPGCSISNAWRCTSTWTAGTGQALFGPSEVVSGQWSVVSESEIRSQKSEVRDSVSPVAVPSRSSRPSSSTLVPAGPPLFSIHSPLGGWLFSYAAATVITGMAILGAWV